MISYHPTNFGDHEHCGNGDIVFLVCRAIYQDHVARGSCDFMVRGPAS